MNILLDNYHANTDTVPAFLGIFYSILMRRKMNAAISIHQSVKAIGDIRVKNRFSSLFIR